MRKMLDQVVVTMVLVLVVPLLFFFMALMTVLSTIRMIWMDQRKADKDFYSE